MVKDLGTFDLFVADGTTWLGQVDVFESARIVARFNDVSTWEVTLPTDSAAAALFRSAVEPRLVVTSQPTKVFRSGPVTHTERVVDRDTDMTTFSGVDDLIWLRRRLAHPEPGTAAPPYDGQSHDIRTGPASQVIAEYVDVNAGPGAVAARQVPGLTVPTPAAFGGTVHKKARYQNLLTFIQKVAESAGVGFRIRDLEFTVFTPVITDVVFSTGLGTLAGWRSAHDAPTANYVYVGGSGFGVNRIITEHTDTASVTDWGRIETFVDQRDTSDTDELAEAGAETLTEGAEATELELEATDTPSQKFLDDWQLGDIATASADGQTITDVIREVTIDLLANQPPIVVPTVGGKP